MATGDLVNLSLDEIISKQSRFKSFGYKASPGRGGRGGGSTRGNFRGRRIPVITPVQRKQKLFGTGGRFSEKLCTVQISNLGPMVTTADLQELFAEHPYVDIAVHYDQFGKSRGSAVVLFRRFDEAMRLKREFTGVKLDGRLMELFAISNAASVGSARGGFQPSSDFGVRKKRISKFPKGRMSSGFLPKKLVFGKKSGRSGVLGGGGRGQRQSNPRSKMSAEELDRELDAYMQGSKHTRVEAP